jgi:hypothetical protein
VCDVLTHAVLIILPLVSTRIVHAVGTESFIDRKICEICERRVQRMQMNVTRVFALHTSSCWRGLSQIMFDTARTPPSATDTRCRRSKIDCHPSVDAISPGTGCCKKGIVNIHEVNLRME